MLPKANKRPTYPFNILMYADKRLTVVIIAYKKSIHTLFLQYIFKLYREVEIGNKPIYNKKLFSSLSKVSKIIGKR